MACMHGVWPAGTRAAEHLVIIYLKNLTVQYTQLCFTVTKYILIPLIFLPFSTYLLLK
jgi:hypothetical protein